MRQQRQAASKAASKQREMLMEDVGSEEEPEEEDEAPFQESMWRWLAALVTIVGCDRGPVGFIVDAERYSQYLKLDTCYEKRWL